MHEIEHMVRLVLAAGPQRAADVREWVCSGSGYSESKFYMVTARMAERGDLQRDLWALELTPQKTLLARLRPQNMSHEELRDLIAHERDVLMQGEDAERLAAQAYANEVESWRG